MTNSTSSHLRVLIHRSHFLKYGEDNRSNQVVVNAACRISRIAEDMSAQGTLRYGQMHLITALFAALCIHALGIRRHIGMSQRIAEHRAQLCLLCLKEIQKYWRVNNNVLDIFLQYLDSSIAKRLHGGQGQQQADNTASANAPVQDNTHPNTNTMNLASTGSEPPGTKAPWPSTTTTTLMSPTTANNTGDTHMAAGGMAGTDAPDAHHRPPLDLFEDQYLSLVSGHWEGDDALGDLAVFLGGDEFMQSEGMDFLGRSL